MEVSVSWSCDSWYLHTQLLMLYKNIICCLCHQSYKNGYYIYCIHLVWWLIVCRTIFLFTISLKLLFIDLIVMKLTCRIMWFLELHAQYLNQYCVRSISRDVYDNKLSVILITYVLVWSWPRYTSTNRKLYRADDWMV